MKVKVSQSYLTLWDPMDHIVNGIIQDRIMEWVAVPFFRGSSQPRGQTQISWFQVDSFPAEPQGKPKNTELGSLSLFQWIFPTQKLNQCLLYCRWIFYQLNYLGSPNAWSVINSEYWKLIIRHILHVCTPVKPPSQPRWGTCLSFM